MKKINFAISILMFVLMGLGNLYYLGQAQNNEITKHTELFNSSAVQWLLNGILLIVVLACLFSTKSGESS